MNEIPLLPKLDTIVVNTDNLLAWNRMKQQKVSGTQEIENEVSSAISKWLAKYDEARQASLQFITDVEISGLSETEQVDEDREADQPASERNITSGGSAEDAGGLFVLKLTVSAASSADNVQRAIYKLLSLLKRSYFDLVLLAVRHNSRTELTPESFYEPWRGVESAISEELVRDGGICDLVVPEHINTFCNSVSIRPSVVQISHEFLLDHVFPRTLNECAEALQIRLTAHKDSTDPLPDDTFRKTMKRLCTSADGDLWQVQWLARYSCLSPSCGTISCLGYVLSAQRDTKQLVQLL